MDSGNNVYYTLLHVLDDNYYVNGGEELTYRYMSLERPPFLALNFRSGSSPFLVARQILYFVAVPEFIIFKISSCSSPPTAGLLQPARTRNVRSGQRPGVILADQSASQTRPSMGNACAFFTISCSRDPHFHARARSAGPPPHFHFAAAHTYQTVGWCPPPRETIVFHPNLKG